MKIETIFQNQMNANAQQQFQQIQATQQQQQQVCIIKIQIGSLFLNIYTHLNSFRCSRFKAAHQVLLNPAICQICQRLEICETQRWRAT